LVGRQKEAVELRQRNNVVGKELGKQSGTGAGADDATRKKSALLDEARALKLSLVDVDTKEKELHDEMERLALALPNLSSQHTPSGAEPEVLGYINGTTPPLSSSSRKSHVDIGLELDLLDFSSSATTSGWGWYFLKNGAALLEQALVQYALSVALKRGWKALTPPSLVYGHIGAACGFMPRDQSGETQVYGIEGSGGGGGGGAGLVLAGTAEIPFAGSKAGRTLEASELPLKVVGPSRCYRAEAGARGVDTKGLYRVHEFTKVEMFAWTSPTTAASSSGGRVDRFGPSEPLAPSQAETVFEEMLSIQKEILTSLGLHARILEMPAYDLGASATRKIDIEVFFPSRASASSSSASSPADDKSYGEVSSLSLCSDYQTRRLGTRYKTADGGRGFPETVNGTALAVPRVLAAMLENGWDEEKRAVRVPEVLGRWMPEALRGWIGRG